METHPLYELASLVCVCVCEGESDVEGDVEEVLVALNVC